MLTLGVGWALTDHPSSSLRRVLGGCESEEVRWKSGMLKRDGFEGASSLGSRCDPKDELVLPRGRSCLKWGAGRAQYSSVVRGRMLLRLA